MASTTVDPNSINDIANRLSPLTARLRELIKAPRSAPCVVVLDGDAGAGKSTAAAYYEKELNAAVVHMDDFFLPAGLRTAARLSEPGGNVHYERFIAEALPKLKRREAFSYRVFDCSVMDYRGEREAPAADLIVVEGAYSLHPKFGGYYDLAVFCAVSPEAQKSRITARAGADQFMQFEAKWIPMERRYQQSCRIRERADLVLTLG